MTKTPSEAEQRDVAARFAAALLHGDGAAAGALLVEHADRAALGFLIQRAAAPWRIQHASIRPPVRRSGNRWTFSYAGRRTQRDGSFETESGHLVVFVARTAAGAGVEFFVFRDVRKRFSTHHDALLLPSNR